MHNFSTKLITTHMMGKLAQPDSDTGTLKGRLELAMELARTNASKIETMLGIKRQTLYRVLSGKTQVMTWDVASRLAEHLGIRAKWLQDGERPMHPVPELKDDDEVQLIESFRHMSPSHQRDLAEIAKRWAEEDDDDRDHSSNPYRRMGKPPPRQ